MMMEKFNITYDDIISHVDEDKRWVIDGKDWYQYYTFTEDEEAEFRKKAIDLIRKRLRCSKGYAEDQFAWWNLNIGLSVRHNKEISEEKDGNN
jgi:hypothetical protein